MGAQGGWEGMAGQNAVKAKAEEGKGGHGRAQEQGRIW